MRGGDARHLRHCVAWISDGTEQGARPVYDAPSAYPRDPSHLKAYNGRVFFFGVDSPHGAELWISDGTEAGTAMVGDIRPGAAGAEPAAMIVFNGQLFFRADDGVHGAELWRLPLVRYTSAPAPGAMLDLGSTAVGQPVQALLQAAMEGIGALPLSVSLAGEHPGAFSVTPAGPVLTEDQTTATLTITCTPGAAGERRAILWINFPAPGSPARYDLRCTGIAAPAPTATPPPAPVTRPEVFIPLVRQNDTRR